MTRTHLIALSTMAALVALAGCSKKPPAQLPPPPPSQTTSPSSGSDYGNGVGRTGVPGSRADMIAQAGSDTVHFATDSSDVDREGHCDERGTREYNLALGDRRANAAKTFLVNAGVPAGRIAVISYGKERPVAMGSDEGAWAQNRRAVTVVPE